MAPTPATALPINVDRHLLCEWSLFALARAAFETSWDGCNDSRMAKPA